MVCLFRDCWGKTSKSLLSPRAGVLLLGLHALAARGRARIRRCACVPPLHEEARSPLTGLGCKVVGLVPRPPSPAPSGARGDRLCEIPACRRTSADPESLGARLPWPLGCGRAGAVPPQGSRPPGGAGVGGSRPVPLRARLPPVPSVAASW